MRVPKRRGEDPMESRRDGSSMRPGGPQAGSIARFDDRRPSGPARGGRLARPATLRTLAMVLALAGCGPLGQGSGPTAPGPSQSPNASDTPGPCPAARLEGTLKDDAGSLSIVDVHGQVWHIKWPEGYSFSADIPRLVLDGGGRVVARSGDAVVVGGMADDQDEIWIACGEIQVLPVPSALGSRRLMFVSANPVGTL